MHKARVVRVLGVLLGLMILTLMLLAGCGSSGGDRAARTTSTTTLPMPSDPHARLPWDRGPVRQVTFAPVLASFPCPGRGLAEGEYGGADPKVCYRLGPTAASGRALKAAQLIQDGNNPKVWTVLVTPTNPPNAKLRRLMDACAVGANWTCPPTDQTHQLGSVAILADGVVISAPVVNGLDIARHPFVIQGSFTKREAEAVAAAIGS